MDDKPPVFPQWPGEPGHMPDDVKERINELLFYSLPPTVTIGDMETIACRFIEAIESKWHAIDCPCDAATPQIGEK
jgi:hypothetical protein